MQKYGNKIVAIVEADLETLAVHVAFADSVQGWVSLKNVFADPKGLAAEVMRGDLFEACFLDAGALAWPNGLELCPDTIRQWFESQKSGPDFAA